MIVRQFARVVLGVILCVATFDLVFRTSQDQKQFILRSTLPQLFEDPNFIEGYLPAVVWLFVAPPCGTYLLALSRSISQIQSNASVGWTPGREAKRYGNRPLYPVEFATCVLFFSTIGILTAFVGATSLGAGVAMVLQLGVLSINTNQLVVDDRGAQWRGCAFTWHQVQSWSIRHIRAYDSGDDSYGESERLIVRLEDGRKFEEDTKAGFAEPFQLYAAEKFDPRDADNRSEPTG